MVVKQYQNNRKTVSFKQLRNSTETVAIVERNCGKTIGSQLENGCGTVSKQSQKCIIHFFFIADVLVLTNLPTP